MFGLLFLGISFVSSPGVASAAGQADCPYMKIHQALTSKGVMNYYWTIDQPAPIDYNSGDTSYVPYNWYKYYGTSLNPSYWNEFGTEVYTGITIKTVTAGVGQHVYDKPVVGEVPIGKWVVDWKWGHCYHGYSQRTGTWGGIDVNSSVCGTAYYSGWNAYCADCGQLYKEQFVYSDAAHLKELKYLNTDWHYQSVCNSCRYLWDNYASILRRNFFFDAF